MNRKKPQLAPVSLVVGDRPARILLPDEFDEVLGEETAKALMELQTTGAGLLAGERLQVRVHNDADWEGDEEEDACEDPSWWN